MIFLRDTSTMGSMLSWAITVLVCWVAAYFLTRCCKTWSALPEAVHIWSTMTLCIRCSLRLCRVVSWLQKDMPKSASSSKPHIPRQPWKSHHLELFYYFLFLVSTSCDAFSPFHRSWSAFSCSRFCMHLLNYFFPPRVPTGHSRNKAAWIFHVKPRSSRLPFSFSCSVIFFCFCHGRFTKNVLESGHDITGNFSSSCYDAWVPGLPKKCFPLTIEILCLLFFSSWTLFVSFLVSFSLSFFFFLVPFLFSFSFFTTPVSLWPWSSALMLASIGITVAMTQSHSEGQKSLTGVSKVLYEVVLCDSNSSLVSKCNKKQKNTTKKKKKDTNSSIIYPGT